MEWFFAKIEQTLGSGWIVPVLLGVMVGAGRIDWFTFFVACVVYTNLKARPHDDAPPCE
jgi:hypothetical protein